ncbi:MAG: hypothetical protein ACRYF4_05785 [Janthinobacterium lividum]
MICTLKVRQSFGAAEDVTPYWPKIVSKHAVGGAGGLLSDEVGYPTLPELLQAMHTLELPSEILALTATTLETTREHWLPVGTALQISFETLSAAGFSLSEGE